MKSYTKKINAIAINPWFLVVSGVSSVISFMWFLYDKYSAAPGWFSGAVFASSLAALVAGYVYSIRVRTENIALRGVAEISHEINRIYRDALLAVFCSERPETDPETLLFHEEQALKAVCQRIGTIFTRVLGRNCMVTVKLATTEAGGCFAHTYVRSQDLSERDALGRQKYIVGTGENSAFDSSLAKRSDGKPSHFFSADLKKHPEGYSNQRQHYDRFYRSTIVVPIRGYEGPGKEVGYKENHASDLIGFLCVDTMSANRLNSGNHLFMLSAFSNQMYNFMSLMRGKYTVVVG